MLLGADVALFVFYMQPVYHAMVAATVCRNHRVVVIVSSSEAEFRTLIGKEPAIKVQKIKPSAVAPYLCEPGPLGRNGENAVVGTANGSGRGRDAACWIRKDKCRPMRGFPLSRE